MIEESNTDARAMLHKLLQNPFDGRIKLWLTYTLLNLRKKNPELFLKGRYIPLKVEGKLKNNLMAFARNFKDQWLVVIVPLITADLSEKPSGEYLTELDWQNTLVDLPKTSKGEWKNILTGKKFAISGSIRASEVFMDVGVGLLVCQ